jgi:hypothetical protein
MMRDEKLVRAAVRAKQPVERAVWVWGAMLESASEVNDGGRYELDPAEVAYFLRCDAGDIVSIENALVDLGRVRDGLVVQWAERQFESDGSKARQRRYRDRQKAQSDAANNDRQVPRNVTPPSRDGVVTPQETETETYPVASATDAASPVDPRDALWREGVSSLKAMTGKTDGAARSLVGKWLSAAHDDCALVLGKIRTAQAERIIGPVAWITAALKPPDKPPKKLTQGESLRNMARAAGVIDDTGNPARRLETSDRDGENPGVGDVIRLAVAGNHGW